MRPVRELSAGIFCHNGAVTIGGVNAKQKQLEKCITKNFEERTSIHPSCRGCVWRVGVECSNLQNRAAILHPSTWNRFHIITCSQKKCGRFYRDGLGGPACDMGDYCVPLVEISKKKVKAHRRCDRFKLRCFLPSERFACTHGEYASNYAKQEQAQKCETCLYHQCHPINTAGIPTHSCQLTGETVNHADYQVRTCYVFKGVRKALKKRIEIKDKVYEAHLI